MKKFHKHHSLFIEQNSIDKLFPRLPCEKKIVEAKYCLRLIYDFNTIFE